MRAGQLGTPPTAVQNWYFQMLGTSSNAVNGRPPLPDYLNCAARIRSKTYFPSRSQVVWKLIEGDVEIIPGFHSLVTGGHTNHHQAIVIESEGERAIYLADLCPTSHHLPQLWGIAYDVDMLQVRRKKLKVLSQITHEGWLALFDHDPQVAAAKLQHDDKRDFAVSEAFEVL